MGIRFEHYNWSVVRSVSSATVNTQHRAVNHHFCPELRPPNFQYLKWVLNVSWDCSWLQWRTFGMTCGKLPSFKLPLNWQNKQFFDSTLNSLCENVLHCKCLAVSLLLNGTEMWTVTFIFERLNKVKKEEELWKRLNKFYIILCKTLEPTVISLYFASKHPHFLKHFKRGLER